MRSIDDGLFGSRRFESFYGVRDSMGEDQDYTSLSSGVRGIFLGGMGHG